MKSDSDVSCVVTRTILPPWKTGNVYLGAHLAYDHYLKYARSCCIRDPKHNRDARRVVADMSLLLATLGFDSGGPLPWRLKVKFVCLSMHVSANGHRSIFGLDASKSVCGNTKDRSPRAQ